MKNYSVVNPEYVILEWGAGTVKLHFSMMQNTNLFSL